MTLTLIPTKLDIVLPEAEALGLPCQCHDSPECKEHDAQRLSPLGDVSKRGQGIGGVNSTQGVPLKTAPFPFRARSRNRTDLSPEGDT